MTPEGDLDRSPLRGKHHLDRSALGQCAQEMSRSGVCLATARVATQARHGSRSRAWQDPNGIIQTGFVCLLSAMRCMQAWRAAEPLNPGRGLQGRSRPAGQCPSRRWLPGTMWQSLRRGALRRRCYKCYASRAVGFHEICRAAASAMLSSASTLQVPRATQRYRVSMLLSMLLDLKRMLRS